MKVQIGICILKQGLSEVCSVTTELLERVYMACERVYVRTHWVYLLVLQRSEEST